MLFLFRRIERTFEVTVQRSHHASPGEHPWPTMLCDQEKRLRCALLLRLAPIKKTKGENAVSP